MAVPVAGGVTTGPGGVQIVFRPPLEFIARQAGRFGAELRNLNPLWDRFKPIMSAIERERFAAHGPGWAGLADSTLRQKARYGFPSDPLVRTGKLRDSLVSEQAAQTGPQQMIWGTGVEYARYHQEGTSRMPARKLIEIRPEDRQKFEQAMIQWINEVAAKSFGRIAA